MTKGANGSHTITVTRRDGSTVITETITTTSTTVTNSAAAYLSAPKRPRIESNFRREFETEIANLSEWFDKTEVNIELLTSEPSDPQDQLTLEEQMVLVQVGEAKVKGIMGKVVSLGTVNVSSVPKCGTSSLLP